MTPDIDTKLLATAIRTAMCAERKQQFATLRAKQIPSIAALQKRLLNEPKYMKKALKVDAVMALYRDKLRESSNDL